MKCSRPSRLYIPVPKLRARATKKLKYDDIEVPEREDVVEEPDKESESLLERTIEVSILYIHAKLLKDIIGSLYINFIEDCVAGV